MHTPRGPKGLGVTDRQYQGGIFEQVLTVNHVTTGATFTTVNIVLIVTRKIAALRAAFF